MKLEYTKKPYEIAIYRNELSSEYPSTCNSYKKLDYFRQVKIASIGSNKYKSPIDACSPKFTINISGKKTLTFNMYYQYFDYTTGQFEFNPYVKLLHNDTLISLTLDGQVYDLLITKITKNTENTVFNYTAEDAYIIELGRNGFNAELALELENNMGTVQELGSTILAGSDWRVHPDSDLIVQSLEDSLYKIEVKDLSFSKRTDYLPDSYYMHNTVDYSREGKLTGTIYAFYNDITDLNKQEIGFLYWGEGAPELNADSVVVNSYNYVTTDLSLRDKDKVLSILRGRRVVRGPKTKFDFDLKRTCLFFKNKEDKTDQTEYYGYAETDYMTPVLTQNYISNPYNMTSLYDWGYVNHGEKTETRPRLLWKAMPEPEYAPYVSYLQVEAGTEILNKGLQGHRDNIQSLCPGDKFILAFLEKTSGYENEAGNSYNIPGNDYYEERNAFGGTNFDGLSYSMAFYKYKSPDSSDIDKFKTVETVAEEDIEQGCLMEGTFHKEGDFTVIDSVYPNKSRTYAYCEMVYNGPTITDLTEDLGSFLGFFIKSKYENRFYEIMVFKEKWYDGEIVYPGRIFTAADRISEDDTDMCTPLCNTYYNIYKKEGAESVLVDRTLNTDKYEIVFNENCEKVGSVTGKEQNYYTLLSNLTKTFECWMEPVVDRDEQGNIIYEPVYYPKNKEEIKYKWVQHYIGTDIEIKEEEDKISDLDKDDIDKVIKVENDNARTSGSNGMALNYYLNGKPIPVKEVSYIEQFEKFNTIGFTQIPKSYIDNRYFLNYLYIVDYHGEDTSASPARPQIEYYTLEFDTTSSAGADSRITCIMKPRKFIKFRNYLNETPNWSGFKYGVNVKSIQRTEDNSKFATKVIVKNNNNEYALKGDKLCTIARAENNPTKDNFIIDFGYYMRKGMLDREKTYKDLYENWFPQFKKLNEQNEAIIDNHVHHSTALDKIQAEYETYYLAYNAAWESVYKTCKEVENCGEQYSIMNQIDKSGTYDFSDWHFGGLDAIKDNVCILLYADSESDMTCTKYSDVYAGAEFSDATNFEMEWYDLPVVYVKNKRYYTVNGSTLLPKDSIVSYQYYYVYVGDDNLEKAFGKDTKVLNHHTYEGLPTRGHLYHNKTDYYWNEALYGFVCKIDEDLLKAKSYEPIYKRKLNELENLKTEMNSDIKNSIDVVSEKRELLSLFNSKYSDFIRESSWSKDDYIDDELYYLDARDSLHSAAFPQISYSIAVVDLAELEGYKVYDLKVGDYTFVEDTEFFGYDDKGRPAKEWVVVTEAVYDLEQPMNNSIKVQNYKSQLEDLFSRLSASIQNLELTKGGYNREIRDNSSSLGGAKVDSKGIYSSNYNKELGTGWALFSDGTYFLGNLTSS